MADFTNNDGRTYSGIRSTVGFGPHTLGVIKFKPAGLKMTTEAGYELGDPDPKVFIDGKNEYDVGTLQVRAREWERVAAAMPDECAGKAELPISVTLQGNGLPTLPYNYARAKITAVAPNELDSGAIGEAVNDIEFMVLRIRSGERSWS
jgi:hypothetical protein